MNGKKKLVVVVLVLMMMVTAVAYAAWSDTIDVDGTATTGKFDVQFVGLSKSATAGYEGQFAASITSPSSADVNDHVQIDITKAKPGEVYTVNFSAKNVGTLKALINADAVQTSKSANLAAIADTLSYQNDYFKVELLSDGEQLEKADIISLDPNDTQAFTIKITVSGNSSSGDITETNVTFSYDFTYSQVAPGDDTTV